MLSLKSSVIYSTLENSVAVYTTSFTSLTCKYTEVIGLVSIDPLLRARYPNLSYLITYIIPLVIMIGQSTPEINQSVYGFCLATGTGSGKTR